MLRVRRLVSLLLCLLVGACLTLPAQVAYRYTAMADRRLAEPCCPSELLPQLPPDHATLSDHCCERIPQPALDTPGTRPGDGAGKHSLTPPILLVVQTLTAALDRQLAAHTAARVEPRGVPPSTPLPRAGVTVLQI